MALSAVVDHIKGVKVLGFGLGLQMELIWAPVFLVRC